MQIYFFDLSTGERIKTNVPVVADQDPMDEGSFLIPSNATNLEPLADQDGYTQVFNNEAWDYVQDNRGLYYNAAGEMVYITELGQSPNEDWTTEPPAPPEPTQQELLVKEILTLEAQQTPRRIREAVLGVDAGWLANLNTQIAALRAQLS